MTTEISVHDNFVYAFSVDCERRKLVLHTAYRDNEPNELTDVVFHDVVAHHIEHVLPGNILMDVEEQDLAFVVRENADLFARSWRYGWPPVKYSGDLASLIDALQALPARAWSIDASCGLSGWVLATECERVRREQPASVA
ncbi:MAG TPA: hypothetical protein VFV75_07715 [Candidatus Polarisedimenticolaceae bacterium]|nr:hypothetical protein [Candidatus Polarisedimenticolaceae bacterium]